MRVHFIASYAAKHKSFWKIYTVGLVLSEMDDGIPISLIPVTSKESEKFPSLSPTTGLPRKRRNAVRYTHQHAHACISLSQHLQSRTVFTHQIH